MSETIKALPVRIIPFDLGREIRNEDVSDISFYISKKHKKKSMSSRQESILKSVVQACNICGQEDLSLFIYSNGIAICTVIDEEVPFQEDKDFFQ